MRKRTLLPVVLLVAVLALLLMIPTVVMPTFAEATVTTYANNNFESLTVGASIKSDKTNFFATTPSLATVANDNGNKVIKLPVTSGAGENDTRAEYVVYGGTAYTVAAATDESGPTVTIGEVTYPIVDGALTIDGVVYPTSTDARYYELRFGGANVDRNITVKTQQISYATEDRVYLQTEYYISEDAKGSVQSQFLTFSYENAEGKRVTQSWYSLFYLMLDDGGLKTGSGSQTVYGVLDKGAWNTVTVVVNLDDGSRDYYVNNRYVMSDASYQNLILNKDAWIVAKVNKNAGDPEALGGYICIDDTQAVTFTDSDIYNAPVMNEKGHYLLTMNVTGSTGRTYTYSNEGALAPVFCGAGASVEPHYYDFTPYKEIVAPVAGASVRLTHAAGMRYATQLDLDLLEQLLKLEEDGIVSDVSIGTLISPTVYVQRAGAFTVDALNALEGSNAKFVNVKGTIGAYHTKLPASALKAGYDTYFAGSLTNIKLSNRSVDFSAIGYVKVALKNGMDVYFYSYDYDASTIGSYSRNVKNLASEALQDPNASYTEAQRVILAGFVNGAASVTLNSSTVQDVQYTATELFFRNAAGVYCRLTYEGKNSWRLQANNKSYNSFDETGAGQALSIYLGETVENKSECLNITKGSDRLTVRVDSSDSYVELGTGTSFFLSFYTGEGKLTSRVTSVETTQNATTTADGTVILRGQLAEGEAIYGGGERFDVVNQRGKAFQLYTRDGWNRADTTYMAIPLFVTTRGAGMFVNRYENMAVDFGKSVSDEWKITINNDLMDCYFYATGKMSDALLGYTEISGHSSLPEEWAQGELICRYSPDLSSFEDRVEYTTYYESHRAIPEYARYGAYSFNYSKYTAIPDYTKYYVQNKTDTTVFAQISSNPSTSAYNFDMLYFDAEGSALAYGKVSGKYYPLGRNWATLQEIDEFGTFAYNLSILYQMNFTDSVATGINGSKRNTYVLTEEGYRKMGAKGNPAGHGVKTIVENLINAGMTPTAMVLEPWNWRNTTSSEASRNALKETVEWLENLDVNNGAGIKTMLYMGVGGISADMMGYKKDYHVWATMTYPDGSTARTYAIPKTSGTGENPDVGDSATQAYIDITNPRAVDWYMNEIWGLLIDIGVDGIKIDFCETMPDEGNYVDSNGDPKFALTYDWYDDSIFDGDDVHHAYSTYFISLFYKSMLEQKAEKNIPDGFVVLSRGGGIGSQRNPYLWEGDQARTFEKIEDQLIALINSGISGVPFMTYDMAGYAYQSGTQFTGTAANSLATESEVFARAVEFTAFTSNIQTHGDVRHAYQMTEETQEIYRRFTDIHELLIPYIQKYSQVAVDTGMPVVRAMVLEYQEDASVYNLETQYMLGKALLVAPVLTAGATTKSVYLPEGTWLDLLTGETLAGGQTVVVNAALGQLPVFMNVDCSAEDHNLLVDVFNSESWKKINGGIDLDLVRVDVKGDPWLEDVFED